MTLENDQSLKKNKDTIYNVYLNIVSVIDMCSCLTDHQKKVPLTRYPRLEVGLCTLVCVYAFIKARLNLQHRIPQLQALHHHFCTASALKRMLE